MDMFVKLVNSANTFLWNVILILLLCGTGIYYTLRLKFVQIREFKQGLKQVFGGIGKKHEKKEGEMTSFQSVATAIAAQVGTGNLTGAATALIGGGPGAIFWMWMSAFFGMATIYAEATLAQNYKTVQHGEVTGGPVYYIHAAFKGLFGKILGVVFAIFLILALGFMGNMVQSNSISTAFSQVFTSRNISIPPFTVGLFLAVISLFVFIGGTNRLAAVVEKLVPFMALLYILLGLGVILLNIQNVPAVFVSIFRGAFQPRAVTGGIVLSMFTSLKKGVSRGIFSNEAGLGTGSIAHACADTKKPVKQGMFGIFEVFTDTIVICTLTALVILCSGVAVDYGKAAGAELTILGFTSTYGSWVSIFTAVAMCCFAFSTAVGWGLYGARCIEFLFSEKVIKPFMVIYSLVAILGATANLGLMWSIAETFNGLMAIPNLIALFLLSGTVVKLTKEYFAGEGKTK